MRKVETPWSGSEEEGTQKGLTDQVQEDGHGEEWYKWSFWDDLRIGNEGNSLIC